MSALNARSGFNINDLRLALLITRREVRDSFRDWRIIIPMILLTLVFPALATFTARTMFRFVEQFGSILIGERVIPFMLLIVGFFPMTFSLVIALETFVGEKERKSLEPLLSTPLTNTQLYVGKMLAAVIPPMSTSYLGISIYLIGLLIATDWEFSWQIFVQIITLTTLQGIIMVAAAVIVSGQTNSVRAANLLASFIIVPIALLLQFEAIVLFWGNTRGLWWLILALLVTIFIFIRMGIKIFNREELLGQDIDQLRLGWIGRRFWDRFTGRTFGEPLPNPIQWYRQTLAVLPEVKLPAVTALFALAGGIALGVYLANLYPLSSNAQSALSTNQIVENTASMQLFYARLPLAIFFQNLRVILLAGILGIFTLGVTDHLIFMLPWVVIGYLAGQLGLTGQDPLLFFVAGILPHALLELPALLLATAAALRWHASIMARPAQGSISDRWLLTAADFCRIVIGIVIPLLIIAAFVEALITPQVILWVYGD